jgi:hypothetical protein
MLRVTDRNRDAARRREGAVRVPVGGPAAGLLALQRHAGNHAVSRLLADGRGAAHLQRYVLQNPVSAGANDFKSQVKQGTGSFRTAAETVDVQPGAGAGTQLRVSEDGQMAIENTDLSTRQPKVFYATQAVLDASTAALKAHNSIVTLYVDKNNAIKVTDQAGNEVRLHRIMPKKLAQPGTTRGMKGTKSVKGLGMPIDEMCGTVADHIAGIQTANLLPTLARDLGLVNPTDLPVHEYKIARWFYQRWFVGNKAEAHADVSKAVGTGAAGGTDDRDQIARDYMDMLTNAPIVSARIAEKLGVNQYADPHIGQAFGSVSLGSTTGGVKDFSQVGEPKRQTTQQIGQAIVRDIWTTHYAAVVAESAGNKVTLENYARKGEGEPENFSGPVWYFQMYGPTTNAAQTWHGTWSTGAHPVLNALTMVYG